MPNKGKEPMAEIINKWNLNILALDILHVFEGCR